MTLAARSTQMTQRERVFAVIHGEAVDRPPVSVWRHFPEIDMTAEGLADATVAFQRRFDWDLVKFMPPGIYSIVDYVVETDWVPNDHGVRTVRALRVTHPEQWRDLPRLDARSGFLGQQNRAMAQAIDRLGSDVPVLQTIFSPLTTARKLAGNAVFAHLRADPVGFGEAFERIVETTIDLVRDAIEVGGGVFYATQCATGDTLSEAELQAWEFEPARRILAGARDTASPVIVHVHGEAPSLHGFAELGIDGLNWHDRTGRPSLAEARRLFPERLLVGGIDGWGALLHGDAAEIHAQVGDSLQQTKSARVLLAPGCVISTDATDQQLDVLRAASHSAADELPHRAVNGREAVS